MIVVGDCNTNQRGSYFSIFIRQTSRAIYTIQESSDRKVNQANKMLVFENRMHTINLWDEFNKKNKIK